MTNRRASKFDIEPMNMVKYLKQIYDHHINLIEAARRVANWGKSATIKREWAKGIDTVKAKMSHSKSMQIANQNALPFSCNVYNIVCSLYLIHCVRWPYVNRNGFSFEKFMEIVCRNLINILSKVTSSATIWNHNSYRVHFKHANTNARAKSFWLNALITINADDCFKLLLFVFTVHSWNSIYVTFGKYNEKDINK